MIRLIRNAFSSCSDDKDCSPFHYVLPRSIPAAEKSTTNGTAVGVIRLVIQSANIKKILFRTPRPFVRIGLRSDPRVHSKTSVLKQRTHSPNWILESTDIIVYSLQDTLEFQIMNDHKIFKPSLVGLAAFPLGILDIERSLVGVERFIRDPDPAKMNPSGILLFDLFYYPVISAARLQLPEKKQVVTSPDSGIVSLQIQGANDFFVSEDRLPKPRNLVARVSTDWTKAPIYTTLPSSLESRTLAWNLTFDFICFQKSRTNIIIKLTDGVSSCSSKNPLIYGHVSVALDELLIAQDEKQRKAWSLSGCPHGTLNMSAEWKSIDIN